MSNEKKHLLLSIESWLFKNGILIGVYEIITHMCHGQKSRFIGDGRPPTFNRNLYNGCINPWVDEFLPYYNLLYIYMEIMGV